MNDVEIVTQKWNYREMIDNGAGIYSPITLKDSYVDGKPEVVDAATETPEVTTRKKNDKTDATTTTTTTTTATTSLEESVDTSNENSDDVTNKTSVVTALVTNSSDLEDRLLGDDPYSYNPADVC